MQPTQFIAATDGHTQADHSFALCLAKISSRAAFTVRTSAAKICSVCTSAGLPAQAVGVLQDGGLWRYAGTLTAGGLEPAHAAAALERWAGHVQTVRSVIMSAAQTQPD